MLLTRDGDLMATLRLDGLNAMTSADVALDAMKRAVAAIVAQSGAEFGFYVHRLTHRRSPWRRRASPTPVWPAPSTGAWQAHLAGWTCSGGRLYLTVLRRRAALGATAAPRRDRAETLAR